MFTIIMDVNKQLITTINHVLYQREYLVDKVQILIPQFYQDIDLSDWIAVLKYVDQANIPHAETLTKDSDIYKNRIRFYLPVDTELTKYSGDITIRITLTKIDMNSKIQYVLHTGESTITISPLKDYYSFVPDESLEFVDQLIGNLEAKIEATEKIAEIYDMKKADNITYEESKLQLTSNGQKIGDAITLVGGGTPGGDTEFEVVEF